MSKRYWVHVETKSGTTVAEVKTNDFGEAMENYYYYVGISSDAGRSDNVYVDKFEDGKYSNVCKYEGR